MEIQVVCASDLHGQLSVQMPPCDLLLISGDLCPANNHELSYQEKWLDRVFREWLTRQPAHMIVVTWGNHDWIGMHPELVPDLPCEILVDRGIEYCGFNIWGTPWQLEFNDWAFNLKEEALAAKYALIPHDTDILLSHGPPYGFGDQVVGRSEHLGSPSLSARIDELDIQLTVCGHIHTGRGIWSLRSGPLIVNASLLDEQYRTVYAPVELNLYR